DLARALLLEAAILQIAEKARVIDGHDRAEAHRDRRVFPELGHQPRVRIRRQTAALRQFVTEVLERLLGDAAFEKRARVDTGRRMALEVDDVSVLVGVLAAEE